ncbi:unnamed protein product [Clonostachys byssicola]|uniref:Uncharacterized protein n=1 Tax=Clonostachys byssicola TaxID=160290 RepID=A0A9N9Y0Z9_9HYPO|nr:unnamed protein product [Clonostachys byssicola]
MSLSNITARLSDKASIPKFSIRILVPESILDSLGSKLAKQADNPGDIDDFLDSLPELSPRLERLRLLGIDKAQRERNIILGILIRSVEKSLAAKPDDSTRKWMLELAGFNYSKNHNAEFIATLLLDHAIERPWIIETPFMDNVSHILRTQDTTKPKSLSSGLCISHTDCCELFTLVQRHGLERSNHSGPIPKPLGWATVTLPHIPGKSWNESLVFEIDSHLGIAGVIPLSVRQMLPAVPGAGQSLSSMNITGFKQTFLREFQAHVNFEPLPDSYRSYRARVSFQSEDGSIGPMVKRISQMIDQLESAIKLCQANGKCLLGIPFLIRAESSSENDVLSLETLSITDTTLFFQSFKKFAKALRWQETQQIANNITTASRLVLGAEAALSLFGLLIPGAVVVASVAGIASAASTVTALMRDRISEHDDAVKYISRSLKAIFRVIGLDFVDMEESVPVILHYCSLAVQYLSLAVQFSVRGFASPMEFSFLENDVGEFILEGANSGPKIFVTPQPLTCLGDMLGQDVWAFGTYVPIQLSKMDLVACVGDVLSVWGPGQLELGPEGLLDGEDPSSYCISKVFIGGGTLRPHSASGSLPSWHWEFDDIHGTPLSSNVMYEGPVGLRTKIRIGVSNAVPPPQVSLHPTTSLPTITYPLSFTPIGASHENGLCPHSNWQFDRQRRGIMMTHLKDIGTHEGYNHLAGHEMTFQAGQYFALHRSLRWERRQGSGVKTSLLEETQTLSDLIRMLDKNCGLFVSSCTRVMARARLRDVVAFAGPLLYPELFPILGGLSLRDSRMELARALQSRDNLLDWAESRHDDQGEILTNSITFKHLILRVLGRLKSTGVMPTNAFEVAWLSPGLPPKATRASCASNPWLYLFRDGEFMATFACVTPVCLVTQFHTCTSQPDEPPRCSLSVGLSKFALSTRVLPYQDLPSETTGLSQGTPHYTTLRCGEKYLLNLATAEITAKVEELITDRAYRIKVEEERVISRLVKRLVARREVRFIRESNEDLAFPCLISG